MLLWAHGLCGSPNGSKITAIRDNGIEAISPDFNEMELIDRVELIKKEMTINTIIRRFHIPLHIIIISFFINLVEAGAGWLMVAH